MRGVRISYLVEHPEYIPQLALWLFEEWDGILGEKTPEARIKKLNAHMNRDQFFDSCLRRFLTKNGIPLLKEPLPQLRDVFWVLNQVGNPNTTHIDSVFA